VAGGASIIVDAFSIGGIREAVPLNLKNADVERLVDEVARAGESKTEAVRRTMGRRRSAGVLAVDPSDPHVIWRWRPSAAGRDFSGDRRPRSRIEPPLCTEGRGTSPSPARDKRTTSAGSSNTFRLDGDYWTILYEGQALRIKDAKRLRDLAFLLANPGKEIHVTDSIAASGNTESDLRAGAYERMGRKQLAAIGLEASRGERSEAALDAEARSAYRARLAELKEDLAEAERCNDTGRATKAKAELEFITAELASAYGLGGRSRKPGGDPLERARKAIGFRIRESVSRIHRAHRALGLHLRTSVKTGTFCSYAPHEPTPWDVAFQRRPSNR
jgi:hypothetical protein